jgi:hypothetical protein
MVISFPLRNLLIFPSDPRENVNSPGLTVSTHKSEFGDWKMEIGDWKMEIGDWRLEIGN